MQHLFLQTFYKAVNKLLLFNRSLCLMEVQVWRAMKTDTYFSAKNIYEREIERERESMTVANNLSNLIHHLLWTLDWSGGALTTKGTLATLPQPLVSFWYKCIRRSEVNLIKHSTNVIYDSRVERSRKLPTLWLYSRNLRSQIRFKNCLRKISRCATIRSVAFK